MTCAYIGLGSNRGPSLHLLQQALDALAQLPGTQLLRRSRVFRSRPLGPQDQPKYYNAVAAVETTLPPLQLLNRLLGIERRLGRVRNGRRWRERRIDLDLLLYGQLSLQHPRLTLPHPGLAERVFVVLPLAEIAGHTLEIPGVGPLSALLPRVDSEELEPVEDV